MKTVSDILVQLDRTHSLEALHIKVGHVGVAIHCSADMKDELRRHFSDALSEIGEASVSVEVLDEQYLSEEPDWSDWAREPGKTGRKDAYVDLADGRLVRKVRTGMTFLQSDQALIAFGPCADNPNQVINFINTQILNTCKRGGWDICHAAAVTNGKVGLAIAGLSGGGKSTTLLRLMDLPNTRFVTNDRLMVKAEGDEVSALGIPKNPRINPGTILHNPRLASMFSEERRDALLAIPPEDLWKLEEKHDLFIGEVYGEGRVQFSMNLSTFWVLNWSRDAKEPTALEQVDLNARPDLLGAIMKSAGPFFQNADGVFLKDTDPLESSGYLENLRGVTVLEVTGRIDFDALARAGQDVFA